MQIIDVRWYNACADFAVSQAVGLQRIGHELLLIANPGSPPALKARDFGLNVNDDINFSTSNLFRAVGRLKAAIREFKPDIVFAHRGESHLIGALAVRKTNIPLTRFRGDVRPPRSGIFSRYLNQKLTAGIAVSTAALKNRYEDTFDLDPGEIPVIYPAIDISRFEHFDNKAESKKTFGLHPDKPVVGIVGRFSPVKGHRYFLEAARIIALKRPDVQFVVAGPDAQLTAEDIKKEGHRIGLENLRLFGTLGNIDTMTACFDIGVIASTGSEMICRVLLEYFAAGAAAVGTAVNQIEELLQLSKAGICIPPADSEKMAEAVDGLLADDADRIRLARTGRQWVAENRSLEKLGQETELFLRGVING